MLSPKTYSTPTLIVKTGNPPCSNSSRVIFTRFFQDSKENIKPQNQLPATVKLLTLVSRFGKQEMILSMFRSTSIVNWTLKGKKSSTLLSDCRPRSQDTPKPLRSTLDWEDTKNSLHSTNTGSIRSRMLNWLSWWWSTPSTDSITESSSVPVGLLVLQKTTLISYPTSTTLSSMTLPTSAKWNIASKTYS